MNNKPTYRALEQKITELEKEIYNIKHLGGIDEMFDDLVCICASCKSIKEETGNYVALETYFSKRDHVSFSHGICAPCAKEHYDYEE